MTNHKVTISTKWIQLEIMQANSGLNSLTHTLTATQSWFILFLRKAPSWWVHQMRQNGCKWRWAIVFRGRIFESDLHLITLSKLEQTPSHTTPHTLAHYTFTTREHDSLVPEKGNVLCKFHISVRVGAVNVKITHLLRHSEFGFEFWLKVRAVWPAPVRWALVKFVILLNWFVLRWWA